MRLLGFLLLALSLLTSAAEKPNIVVIIVDDLGYGDLSSYGATDLKSPHIDALMASGLKFTNFYANCPVCSPTRAALLSGKYQELVGVPGVIRTHPTSNWGYLSPSASLLPTELKKQGYTTAGIGKWHLGLDDESHPNSRGFDHFHGLFFLRTNNARNPALDDPSLFSSDLGQCITEELFVVDGDRCDDGDFWINHVCCVQTPAQPDFQKCEISLFPRKGQ